MGTRHRHENQPIDSGRGTGLRDPVSSRRRLVLSLALVALVTAVFSPALRNGFVSYDDGTYVTANAHVQAGLTLEGITWAFRSTNGSNWHPLTWISHMLDCQVYGLRPWGHHLTNVLLHALNSALVFLLLTQLTGAVVRSLFVAALFGLHPAHVESVAWIAERKDVLSTCFFLLTLMAYGAGRQRTEDRGQRSEVRSQKPAVGGQRSEAGNRGSDIRPLTSDFWYFLALFFFALGLMSKPMLVSLPLVLLLLDFWPLQRVGARPAQAGVGRLLLEKVPFVFLAGVASLVTLWVQRRAGATEMLERLGWGERVGNALIAGCRYLGKLVWPSRLSVFYPHPGEWPIGWVCLAGLALLIFSVVAVKVRRVPFVFVGWFWYLVTLLPVSGLVQVGRQSMADRYTYIPFIGLFLVIGWALPEGRRLKSIVAWAAGAIAVLAFAGQTWRQLGYWKDSESLFRHAISVTENNYVAHSNLGDALQQQGRTEEALAQYHLVLQSRPDEVNARNNLGSLLLNLGRTSEALAEFREAARRAPGFAEGRNNLGYALQRAGKLDEAAAEYARAAELNPKDFRVRLNLASLSLQRGQPAEAVGHLQAALALNPDDAITRKAFGSLLFNLGRIDEAMPQFEAAVKLAPNDAEAHANLGFALGRQGKRERARAELARALALRPDYPEAQEQLRALEKN